MTSKSLGRTIRMYLVDATPEGLRSTDTSGWTGTCLDFSRADYARARQRDELSRSGVYVLVGPNDEGAAASRVYVGEGDVVLTRIDQHQQSREFWTRAFVFTTKDDSLNKAHLRYLEARLIGQVKAAKVAAVDNGTAPEAKGLGEPEIADMENFLQEVLLLLPVLGVREFQVVSVAPSTAPVQLPSPKVSPSGLAPSAAYYLTEKRAQAEGRDEAQGFVVLAGATGPAECGVTSYANLRDQLVADGTLQVVGEQVRLTRDTSFASPSAAAAVIAGGSRNGQRSWKDQAGRTLGENRAATVGAPVAGDVPK